MGSVAVLSGGSYFIGLVLGLAGLSSALLSWLDVISGPLRPDFFWPQPSAGQPV